MMIGPLESLCAIEELHARKAETINVQAESQTLRKQWRK